MRNKEQSLCLLVVTLLFIHQSQATDESPEGVDESWQRDNHHDDHDHESNQTVSLDSMDWKLDTIIDILKEIKNHTDHEDHEDEEDHCEWSAWEMGECSVTCGEGVVKKTRTNRDKDHPEDDHGHDEHEHDDDEVEHCPGMEEIEEHCHLHECPVGGVDGMWGQWGAFGKCSKPCGGGTRSRRRACDSPAPENGGKPCPGPATQAGRCNTKPCAAACADKYPPGNIPCKKSFACAKLARTRKCNKKWVQALPRSCANRIPAAHRNRPVKAYCRKSCKVCRVG